MHAENARMQRNTDALNRKIRESIALVNGPMILVETIIFGGETGNHNVGTNWNAFDGMCNENDSSYMHPVELRAHSAFRLHSVWYLA